MVPAHTIVRRVLGEAKLLAPSSQRPPKTMLDFGTGPGTAIFAAKQVFPSLESALGVDNHQAMLDAAKYLHAGPSEALETRVADARRAAARQADALHAREGWEEDPPLEGEEAAVVAAAAASGSPGMPLAEQAPEEASEEGAGEEEDWLLAMDFDFDEWAPSPAALRLTTNNSLMAVLERVHAKRQEKFDLVTAAYALSELPNSRLSQAAAVALWSCVADGGMLVLVESGAQRQSGVLHAVRDKLLESYGPQTCTVIAPCPHREACPRLAMGETCTFAQRVKTHNRHQKKIPQHRDEAFSYLVLRKGSGTSEELPPEELSRLLRTPRKKKGHVLVDVCTPQGTMERQVVSSGKFPALYKLARKSTWGGRWAADIEPFIQVPYPRHDANEARWMIEQRALLKKMGLPDEEIDEALGLNDEGDEEEVFLDALADDQPDAAWDGDLSTLSPPPGLEDTEDDIGPDGERLGFGDMMKLSDSAFIEMAQKLAKQAEAKTGANRHDDMLEQWRQMRGGAPRLSAGQGSVAQERPLSRAARRRRLGIGSKEEPEPDQPAASGAGLDDGTVGEANEDGRDEAAARRGRFGGRRGRFGERQRAMREKQARFMDAIAKAKADRKDQDGPDGPDKLVK